MRRAGHAPRERDSRLNPHLRRPAGSAFSLPIRHLPAGLARAWRAAACLLVFALLLAGAPDAQAQTTQVSNTGQPLSISDGLNIGHFGAANFEHGINFTTGGQSGGYTLHSVDVRVLSLNSGASPKVSIFSTTSGGDPDSSVHTLTNPGTLTPAAVNTFTAAANATLDANTTYAVILQQDGSTGSFRISRTASDAEDTGAANGWSIADTEQSRNVNASSPTWNSATQIPLIAIKTASTNNAPTVDTEIPDQTAASGTAFSFTFDANAFSDADGDTLSYTAAKSDDGALPGWLSFDASTRTFSGTPAASDVGTVSVKVTASDGTASVSDTFDIVVSAGSAGSGLVSNTGQTQSTSTVGATIRAQAFTTGSNSGGYRLASVGIRTNGLVSNASVRIESSNASNQPGGSLGGLTTTSTRENGVQLFTTTGIALEASTTYFVVWDSVTTTNHYRLTSSDSEDSGGAAGWSIGNTSIHRNDSRSPWQNSSFSLQMVINGAANSAPTVATEIPDQTAASGTAFSFTFDANAFSDADGDTLSYTAAKSDDGALPGWLSFDASTRTFSGTPAASDVGTVSVKVTASDGTASVSDTFDIVVSAGSAGSGLVSNTGQTQSTSTVGATIRAQAFTTGSNSGGYRLASVGIRTNGLVSNASVRIESSNASNQPGGSLGGLTTTSTRENGVQLFTTTGIALEASTTYFVVWDSVTTTNHYRLTSSDSEDSGGAAGWSIGNTSIHRNDSRSPWQNSSFSLQMVINGTLDGTAPTLSSAERYTEDPLIIRLTFDEDIQTSPRPDKAAFTVTVDGANRAVAIVDTDSTLPRFVHLHLSGSDLTDHNVVTVSYDAANAGGDSKKLQDLSGNHVASFTNVAVKTDFTAPTLSSATVEGAALTLTYNEALDGDSVPAASAYTVKVGGTAVDLAATDPVAISGSAVTLTLAAAVSESDTVTVSYAVPSTNPVQDSAGNDAAALTDQAVTHVDTTAPTLVSVEAVTSARMRLTFNENIKLVSNEFPNKAAFTVTVDGTNRTLGNYAWNPTSRPRSLDIGVTGGGLTASNTVTISYDAANAGGDSRKLQDLSGNPVANFTNQPVKTDFTAPTLSSAAVRGATLELAYNEALDGTTAPAASAYTVKVGGTAVSLAATDPVTIAGSAVTLRLAAAVTSSDTVTVSYAVPDMNPVQDTSGNDAAALTDQAVTNNTSNAPAAELVAATVNLNTVTLIFSKDLDSRSKPATSAFAIRSGTTNVTVSSVSVSGRTVELDTGSFSFGQASTGTVAYTAPANNPLQDADGNAVADFPATNMTNTDGGNNPGAPVLSTAAVNGATLTLTYDKALNPLAEPQTTAFTVKGAGADQNPTAVSVAGRAATLTLGTAATSADTVTVSYSTTNAPRLQNLWGTQAAALTDQAVTNNTPAGAPTLSSAAVTDARTITLTFDKAVTVPPDDPNHVNPGQKKKGKFPLEDLRYAFTIQGLYSQGVEIPNVGPHRVQVSGSTVTLTLADAVEALPGRQVKVSYLATNADGEHVEHATLQDSDGNKVADFTTTVTLALSGDLPPVLDRASVAGTRLQLSFDGGLNGAPAGSRFRVHYDESFQPTLGGTVVYGTGTASIIVPGGPAVEVTLAEAVPQDRFASVSYIAGDDANPLRGVSMSPPGAKVADIRGFFPVTVLDRTAPSLVSATLAGTKLVLTYDEPLDTGSTPANGDFTIGTGSGARTVSGVAVNASAVTLTLNASVNAGIAVNVSYTAGTNKIQDTLDAGDSGDPNAAANLSSRTVTNLGPTNTNKPALASADPASAAGPALTLTFTLDLDPAHVPDKSAFTLSAGREVSDVLAGHAGQDAVTVRGKTVVLAMSPSWYPCDDTITVSYAKPTANALRSVWGTQADAFTGQTVTNAWQAECDGTAPRHATLRVVKGGAGGAGAVGLQFEQPLQRDRTPDPDDFTVTSKPGGNGGSGNGGANGNGGAGAQATGNGGPVGIRSAQLTPDGRGVSLGLARSLGAGERLTVAYRRQPGSPGLWTANGDQVDDFTVEGAAPGDETETPAPAIEAVAVVSDAGEDNTYALGDTIEVQVTFDEAVEVDTTGGTPQLTMKMDPDYGAKHAAYASGSGTPNLVFTFEVVEPNLSTAGIAIIENTLDLNGGTIRSAANGADAALAHGGLDHDANHKVDWAKAPPANRAPVLDTGAAEYNAFTRAGNAPRGTHVTKPFNGLFSDPDGDALTYTVALADETQAPLVEFLAIPTEEELGENAGDVRLAQRVHYRADAEGDWDALDPAPPNPVAVTVRVTATDPDGLSASVDGVFQTTWEPVTTPAVTGVAITSNAGEDDTYALGDTIEVQVTFDEAVAVDTAGGTPHLTIKMDPEYGDKPATYESGAGTTRLTFTYEVVEPNYSPQGIAVLENTLALNGGTIRSAATGGDAALAHTGLGHDPAHQVNWERAAPSVTGVAIASNAGADNTYLLGETIRIRVSFTEAVTVAGTPQLTIDMDPADWGEKRAAYASGSGTTALTFTYQVAEPNYSPQGIAVLENTLVLNGGAIRSAATGADALLAHAGLAHDAAHKVDWTPGLSVADADAEEGAGATVDFDVSLSRAFTTAAHSVTVDYATADGTATAGEDYTATSGTLTFAAGELTKTVSVTVLDDAHDEAHETLTLRLSNAAGARLTAAAATGTIKNSDPLPKAWLARFGRTSALHVVDILDARFEAAAPTGDHITLGGRAVDTSLFPRRRESSGQGVAEGDSVSHWMPEQVRHDGELAETRGQSNLTPDLANGHGNEDVTLTPSIPDAAGHAGLYDAAPATWGQSDLMPDGQPQHGPDSGPAPADSAPDATPLERALWQVLTHPGSLNVDQRRFLSQSSFHLSLTNALSGAGPEQEPIETAPAAPDHPGHWSLWGQGALTRFQGTDNGVNLDGEVLTGLLGLDYAKDRWLAGLALAYHDGDGAYTAPGSGTNGDLNSTLITVNPYLRYALTPRLSVWGTLGYGTGALELRPGHESRGQSNLTPDLANDDALQEVTLTPGIPTPGIGEPIETDMSLAMGALGLRGVVYASAHTELALKSDALWVRTASRETDGLQGAAADTRRLRLLLSGRHQRTLPNDALLSPTFEAGIRYDDGDAETGFGMELGGGLGYTDAALGLRVETRARALIAHEDGSYEEWALGGSLSLDPGRLGRGLALRLDSGWGLADSNAEALWQRQTTAGLAPQHGPAAQGRFNAELGYGLDVPWTYGVLTPYGGMEWAGPGRTLKLGWRFNLGQQLSLSLDGERREDGYTRAEHALMLRTSLPW